MRGVARPVALHVVGPVALGAAIYLLARSPALLVFDWAAWAGVADGVHAARDAVHGVAAGVPGSGGMRLSG